MKVKELIAQLTNLNPEAKVKIIYDGEPRMNLDVVYESKMGKIMVTGKNEPVYTDKYRPKDCIDTNPFYTTKKAPN